MALALYQVLTPYPLTINTGDFSGSRGTTIEIPAGETFMGNTADPLVISYLAGNLISLVFNDVPGVANGSLFSWNEGGTQKSFFTVGAYGSALAMQMYQSYLGYWEYC